MRYLITGGCGFLGANLAAEALKRGGELVVVDNFFRHGSRENLAWLQSMGEFSFQEVDIRDTEPVAKLVSDSKPDVVFHMAGQVAMTTSLQNPRLDFEINVLGGINILEAVRRYSPEAALFYSSTNKVYGDLESIALKESETRYEAVDYPQGFSEQLPLDFRSPYGCSKGAIDQYMLDYNRMYDLKTVVFRHSSVFGGQQHPTIDQGWVAWFVQQALESKASSDKKAFTICGNGKQVRDVLFVDDLVRCYFAALDKVESLTGSAFNIGGGMDNSLSLLELFAMLEETLGIELSYSELAWRASDQRVFVADNTKAEQGFGWKPLISKEEGVQQLIQWLSGINNK